jgi:hypothetical protein
MKAVVEFMNGGRTDGYYYIQLEDTNFILCKGGHPDFLYKYGESGEKEAKKIARKVNKALAKLEK